MQHQSSQPDLMLSAEQFRRLRDTLEHYSGVRLDDTRQRVLLAALAQRMAATNTALVPYISAVTQPDGQAEVHQLVELVLNHETTFFRNQPHIRALREVILPQMRRRTLVGRPLRIWSAGCATGEEPYSLAITILETFGWPLLQPVEIWATDLSVHALNKALIGGYNGRTLANVTPEQRARYFEQRNGTWFVRNEVRSLVSFEQMNLLDPFPARANGMDIIFCQNVTIYFQLATCRDLVQRFYQGMAEGSYLFLGFSETLWHIFDGFHSREIAGSFVYYKESHYKPSVYTSLPARNGSETREEQRRVRRASVADHAGARGTGLAAHTHARSGHDHRRRVAPSTAPVAGTQHTPDTGAHDSDQDVLRRGRALLDAGRTEEALAMLSQASFHRADAPKALALIAHAHANRGDLDLAVAEARRALELDALTTEAYLLLGMLYSRQCKEPTPACPALLNAAQQFERARYLEPGSALISFHLADTYRQLARTDLALREYRNTLRKLEAYPPDTLLDGAAIEWIRTTCQRYVTALTQKGQKG